MILKHKIPPVIIESTPKTMNPHPKDQLRALARSWWRGDWGKTRWSKPVKAEAQKTQTCQKCQAAFISATKSELCPDCG